MIYNNIEDAVKASVTEIEEASEKTLQDAGEFARQAAINTDLFNVSSSFKAHTQFHTLDKLNGFVLADRPWAEFLEYGNGPGRIYAKNAKCLHFVVGGKDVFVKSVNSHPPLPFMENAGIATEEAFEGIFIENLNKVLT